MNITKFFIKKVLFKKWILVFTLFSILCLANFSIFTNTRSILTTYQGYSEMSILDNPGTYVSNLDPNSKAEFDKIELDDSQKIYDFLNKNYEYALHSDGFTIPLNNKHKMEILFNYMNETAYNLKKFDISEGNDLSFQYTYSKGNIPILIGKGLSKTYPIGSTIRTIDPVTKKSMAFKVKGVLKQNTFRSNFFAPNLKNYYNFSVIVPVNDTFLRNSGLDLKVNALMDIILIDSNEKKIKLLSKYINKTVGLQLNFFTQKEIYSYFEEYYLSSLKLTSMITLILIFIVISLSVWISLVSVRLMKKEFIIHFLSGLSFSKLKSIFYSYFTIIFSLNIIVLFVLISFNRYSFWLTKTSLSATYGLFGLISVDWISLFIVLCSNFMIGVFIVHIIMRKVKKNRF